MAVAAREFKETSEGSISSIDRVRVRLGFKGKLKEVAPVAGKIFEAFLGFSSLKCAV